MRPFFYASIGSCLMMLFGVLLNFILKKQWIAYDNGFVSGALILMITTAILAILKPRQTTKIVIVLRLLICIFMCYSIQD